MKPFILLMSLLFAPAQVQKVASPEQPRIEPVRVQDTPKAEPKADDSAPSITEAPLDDPELKNLEWNRYVTKNFVILSIDNEKGKKLAEEIDQYKKSALTRWGFPDVQFSKECRVFCVPSSSLLKKLFNLTGPKVQLRKDLNAIWLVLDEKSEKGIIPYVTQVALAELEAAEKTALPFWFKRGAIVLNGSVDDVRSSLRVFNDSARKEQFTHTAEQMFVSTEEEYNKQGAENKKVYDTQAACLCLLLRKEFGEAKLQGLLRILSRNKPDVSLETVYGFKDLADFENSYVAFMKDLCADVARNKTPDAYLTITPVKK